MRRQISSPRVASGIPGTQLDEAAWQTWLLCLGSAALLALALAL